MPFQVTLDGMRNDGEERAWASEEFGQLEVTDARLRARVRRMAKRAMERGGGRISDVFCDGAERQGAYDLLESGSVAGERLTEAMAAACLDRCAGKFVFVPIDGSSIQVVDRGKRTDLGLVGTYTNNGRGLQVVSALAISAGGTPLGLCAQTWWARPTRRRPKVSHSTYRPVHERETRFVVQTIQDVQRRYAASESTPWMVIDRGGDATVILDELVSNGVLFTVRASWNRRVWAGRSHTRLCETLRARRPALHYDVLVPAGHKRVARTARLAVRVACVELDVTHDWRAKRANPKVHVVWVRELRPPTGEKPLDWMLYTSAPIAKAEDLRQVVRSYTMRWRIEDFHKTWKSGHCRVEQTQLRSVAAVKTWATLLAAVAVRIERLRHLAREEPETPATVELTDIEIDALKLLKQQQKKKTETIGKGIPTIALAVRWIADLGGYTGKSSGGPPGATTIGRGLEDLSVAARLLASLRKSGDVR